MDKLIKYILFFLVISFAQNSFAQYKKAPLDSINEEVKSRINNFAYKLYSAKSEYDFPFVGEDVATTYFIENYKKIKYQESFPEHYGEIKTFRLIEVWENEKEYRYFRYKVGFKSTKRFVEIQVALTSDNNLTGVIARDAWKKKFYPGGKRIKLKRKKMDRISESLLKKYKGFAFSSYTNCKESKTHKNKAHNWNLANGNKLMAKECDSIKQKLGRFKNLSLVEVLGDRVTKYIYRYKTNFDALDNDSEIRIYSNIYNEFSGIFVINKWYDKYYYLDKALKKSKEDLN